jgi:hypothetical protein
VKYQPAAETLPAASTITTSRAPTVILSVIRLQ